MRNTKWHVRVRVVGVMLAGLFFAGCAKPTEEQRLAKFRGSLKVKAYRMASDNATWMAAAGYEKAAGQKVDPALVHATLGFVWFLAEKNDYALIEADLTGKGTTNQLKLVSLALQSLALSKMKYPGLSKAHYEELKTAMTAVQGCDANTIEVEHKVCLLSLIVVGLYQGDKELATFGADALGAITQLDYLPPLIGAVVEAKKGSPLKAVAQLRELNKSERFSAHKKEVLAEIADLIENAPDKEKLGDELMERVVIKLSQRVMDDVFSAENQKLLLEKVKALPELITGKTTAKGGEGAVGSRQ
jgi:hypothetical protein